MAVILGGSFYTLRERSLILVSFAASDIRFANDNGTIQIQANITNLSNPSLIQVDAAIDGMNDGVCGYAINTNQTKTCTFANPNPGPLLSCTQISQDNNTLTLNGFFGNGDGLIVSFSNPYTRAQLGCG